MTQSPKTPSAKEKIAYHLNDILINPDAIPQHMSKDYIQIVDGHQLNYHEFVQHVQTVRDRTKTVEFNVTHAVRQKNTIAERHEVIATKPDGSQAHIDVFAFWTFENGKVIRIEEWTHLRKGYREDADLGSRV